MLKQPGCRFAVPVFRADPSAAGKPYLLRCLWLTLKLRNASVAGFCVVRAEIRLSNKCFEALGIRQPSDLSFFSAALRSAVCRSMCSEK
jgi:hypothetical protein